MTILDEEFEAVERQIGPIREIEDAYYEPEETPGDVILMQAPDRTNVAAEQAVRDLAEAFRPEIVIVCGIGGGVEGKDDIGPGDVVVASYLHYGEFRKLSEDGDHDRYLAYDQPSAMLRQWHVHPVKRSGKWKDRVDVERPAEDGEPKILFGPVLAGEKIIGDPDHQEHQRALSRFTDVIAVDMESYGVGRSLHCVRTDVDYDPLLMVIRGISDIVVRPREDPGDPMDEQADEANNAQRTLWKPYACATAAAFTSAMVDRLLSRADLRAAIRK